MNKANNVEVGIKRRIRLWVDLGRFLGTVVKDLAAAGRRAENEVLQDIFQQGGAGIQPPVISEPETESLDPG